MPRTQKPRGLALGTVLLCMVALALILFTAVSASLSHLRLVESSQSGEHARNLADAALAKAVSRMIETDFAFGKSASDRVQVTCADLPGATGIVTFDRGEPGFADGYSTHNLAADNGKRGAGGQQVPGRAVHFVARGKIGGVERWMECVFYRPPFPDGLASTGWVDAKSVDLSAIRKASAYSGGDPRSVPRDQTLPANLFSNSLNGGYTRTATTISGRSRIAGSVGAVGPVSVSADSVVQGEVLPGSEPRAIPDLRLEEKIALAEASSTEVFSTPGGLDLEKNWFSLCNGNLDIGGDLNLNGSVLVVKNGDLKVRGGVKGTGIILCESDVEILDGQTTIKSGEQVAVGCMGDFKLRAESPEGNYFQGLVYSEGDIEAKDITVVGAVVANGKNGAVGSVVLDNVRFIYTPASVEGATFPPLRIRRSYGPTRPAGQRVAPWRHVAFSVAVRRHPSGEGWLANAWACGQFAEVSEATSRRMTQGDLKNPKDWQALAPGTYQETTWTDLHFTAPPPNGGPAPGHTYATDEADVLIKVGHYTVGPWLDSVDGDPGNVWVPPVGGGWENSQDNHDGTIEISAEFRNAKTSAAASRALRLTLNNLFAEVLTDNSRILLWRPYKSQ